MDDYRRVNMASWDERAPAHAASPGYEAPTDVEFTHNVSYSWNHGLAEIVTALPDARQALIPHHAG